MALIQKYDTTATTKTHGLVDGNLFDIINPSAPLNSTGELMRMGVVGLGAWLVRGKMLTGSWSLGGSGS